jgi:O-antigen/teichoic acid export membrane protein
MNLASICSQGLIFVQTVLVMRMLNPELYGIWIGLNIMLVYGGFANLGLEYVLSIRYPYYQGKKDREKCASIADTVYFAWTLATVLYVLGILVYCIMFRQPSKIVFWGLIAISILIIFEQQTTFYNRWITTGERNFSFPSYISILRNAASFFIVIPLVYFFAVEGLMVGSVLVSVMVLLVWNVKTSFKFQWNPSITTLKEMMVIGIPGFVTSIVNSFIKTVDRLLIITFLGATSLGYYGIVAMGGGFLHMFLAQAGAVMVPHMVEHMGINDDSSQSLEKYLIRPTLIFSYASSIFLVILFFTLPLAVELVLPKFLPGLTAFYAFLPGFFFLSIILSANNVLFLILIPRGRQRYIVYLQISAAAIQIGLSMLFIQFKWGIAGIALAATLGSAFWGSAMLLLSTKYVIQENKKRLLFLVNVFKPFLYVLLCLSAMYWFQNQWHFLNTFVNVSMKLFSGFVIIIPLL